MKAPKVRNLKLEDLKHRLIVNGKNSVHHWHCLAELRKRANETHDLRAEGKKLTKDAAKLLAEYEANCHGESTHAGVAPSW